MTTQLSAVLALCFHVLNPGDDLPVILLPGWALLLECGYSIFEICFTDTNLKIFRRQRSWVVI